MISLLYILGAVGFVAFVIGGIIAILYDLGYLYEDPEKARLRKERQRQIAMERQQEAARWREESERLAAREHLEQFFAAHKGLFGNAFPPALMAAFIKSEMGEDLTAAQLWTVCLKKITDLLPLVVRGRNDQVCLQQIDAEIAAQHRKLARSEQSQRELQEADQEADFLKDEQAGILENIQKLEAQKQRLVTLNNGGT